MKQFPQKDSSNIHDHSGYSPSELCITPKYESFKQEILNYKYLSIKDYEKIIIPKLHQYMTTNKVKSIRSLNKTKTVSDRWQCIDLDYDIPDESPLTQNHLLSMILDTDFSALYTDYSKRFRKLHSYEPLQD